MTPAMQAARDRVVEAAKTSILALDAWCAALPLQESATERELLAVFDRKSAESNDAVRALLALEAQEKEQADAEG